MSGGRGAPGRAAAGVERADLAAVAAAVAAALGAWWAVAVPPGVGGGLVAVLALVLAARPGRAGSTLAAVVGVLAVGVATSALSARAWDGLRPPEPGPFAGVVVLATDPEDAFGAVRAHTRAGDGRRCEAWARGRAAVALRPRQAGQEVALRGRLGPEDAPHLAVRHVACRLEVDEVTGWAPGGPAARVANGVRDVLVAGAATLPGELRALFGGLVLGDTRGQRPEVADDLRAAGLTHLLVVSGHNVTFVLVCASPALSRLGRRPRLAVTVAVLAGFALLTRFEPSVLRATAMAGLTAAAATVGRPATGARLLAGAVALLLLVDPFLVRSVGFALSVAASAGIILLARPLGAALPGPGWLARPLAVVLAAQVGVAPVLVPVFGGLPVASVPANLLVEPVAGLAVVWGMTAGLVAGAAAWAGLEPLAALAHLPTRLALGWVAVVARWAADLRLGQLGPGLALLAAGVGTAAVLARRAGRTVLAASAAAVALGALAAPGVAARGDPPDRQVLAGVGELWVARPPGRGPVRVLVLDGRASPEAALAAVRPAADGPLDLVVARAGGARAAATVAVLATRVEVAQVWAPDGHRVPGATTPDPGAEVVAGDLRLRVRSTRPGLDVEVARAPPPGR